MKSIYKMIAAVLLAVFACAAVPQQPGNLAATILPSAARTTTPINSADQNNVSFSSAHVIVNISAYTAGTYTPKVQGKDPVSGNYYDVLVGNPLSATGMTILKIGPGIGAVTNGSAQDFLPKTWRVVLTGASGQSMTLSVGAFLLSE